MNKPHILTSNSGAYLPDLIWTLVRTDFKTRYHGTMGGYCWALVKPLTMFAILCAVFSAVFKMDPNYNLNLIVGLFLWDFFSDATKTGFISLQTKSFLLTKTKVSPWIVVLTFCFQRTDHRDNFRHRRMRLYFHVHPQFKPA